MRRLWFVLMGVWGLVAAGPAAGAEIDAGVDPPNLVLILADDLGWGDVGFMGSTRHHTPNLDRLAAEGVVLRHAYANGSVCAPTRAALLSGMHAARTGVYTVGGGRGRGDGAEAPAFALTTPQTASSLAPDVVTLAEALRDAGYATGHLGKWHLGQPGSAAGPGANGFDVSVGTSRGGGTRTYFAPYGLPGLEEAPQGEYLTDRLTDEAVAFVEDHADRPFFLYLSHYAVHTPIEPKPQVLTDVRARHPGLTENQAAYAAVVESLDRSVGRVLGALDAAGIAKNTVVVFASDNGGHRRYGDTGGLSGAKGSLQEGGIRVPCVVRWPGTRDAGVSDAPVQLMDLYPTFLELAGADTPRNQPVDGRSWANWLRGDAELDDAQPLVWYRPVYVTSRRGRVTAGPTAVIRRGPWKLTYTFEDRRVTLHHLIDDPAEARDRSADEPRVVAALKRELDAWQRATDAPIPQPNPAYRGGDQDPQPRSRRARP